MVLRAFLFPASCRCGSDGDEPNEEKYASNEFIIWAGSQGNFDGATLGAAVTQACGSCRSAEKVTTTVFYVPLVFLRLS